MPSDQPARLTKKQKKATAFRERSGKGKGNLNPVPRHSKTCDDDDEDANAVPAMEDQALANDAGDAARDTQGDGGRIKVPKAASLGAVETTKKKRRREDGDAQPEPVAKRARGSKKNNPTPANDEDDEARADVNEPETRNEDSKQRFILFVGMFRPFPPAPILYPGHHQTERPAEGNLKYTTTREAIQGHFSACGAFCFPLVIGGFPSNKTHAQTRPRRCACSRPRSHALARPSQSPKAAHSSSSQRVPRYKPRSVCTSRSLTGGGSTSSSPRVVVAREMHG
jgi:hypothetical protein